MQIELFNKSNRTVFAFLREKLKVLPIKQQLKWYESLQTSSNSTNWKKIYVKNYFSTIKTKLRSFQLTLTLRSAVTTVQLAGLDINDSEICMFCLQHPKAINHLSVFGLQNCRKVLERCRRLDFSNITLPYCIMLPQQAVWISRQKY